MHKGLFLSLDGPDGAGKSTQCLLLAAWLRQLGHAVTTCVDPGGTALGTVLRDILLHHRQEISPWGEALLFMASRAQLIAEVIRPAMEVGQVVVSDRYLLSTVVYQGYAGGLDPARVREVGRVAAEGLEPDLTLVLDLPLEMSLARVVGRRLPLGGVPDLDRVEGRPRDYQARVRDGFLAEAARHPERIRVVDASGSVEAVQDTVRAAVVKILRSYNE
jgi:dTMP kinase